ncbi:Hypothetical predicted protein [Octopus vulgaris]|uniref:Uncharacterized protein n=1 Tax=Octopus vulgaris TaxID=6645 RepID=A0AA36AZJ6_OCTVU|nr:Hypothetical predicted protein [Octopus vulgaris]
MKKNCNKSIQDGSVVSLFLKEMFVANLKEIPRTWQQNEPPDASCCRLPHRVNQKPFAEPDDIFSDPGT